VRRMAPSPSWLPTRYLPPVRLREMDDAAWTASWTSTSRALSRHPGVLAIDARDRLRPDRSHRPSRGRSPGIRVSRTTERRRPPCSG
jgi:hypothetical protein